MICGIWGSVCEGDIGGLDDTYQVTQDVDSRGVSEVNEGWQDGLKLTEVPESMCLSVTNFM
jgi:hypothetical protein